jgi:signal transduction histidine kinase
MSSSISDHRKPYCGRDRRRTLQSCLVAARALGSAGAYAAVLVAGLYAGMAGLGDTRPLVLAAGLAGALLIDLAERRRYPAGTPTVAAAVLLIVRIALYVVISGPTGRTSPGRCSCSSAVRLLLVRTRPERPRSPSRAWARSWSRIRCPCRAGTTTSSAVSDVLMLALGLVLAVTMAAIAVEERRLRVRLERSNQRLREYADEVAALSTAAERNRLARDIHDGLGHHLTEAAILWNRRGHAPTAIPSRPDTALVERHRAVRQALDDVRRSVRSLHPALPRSPQRRRGRPRPRRNGGAERLRRRHRRRERPPGPRVGRAVRAAQEGITNARRHADAAG